MHRRYALGGLTPPAAAAFIEEPQLIAKYQVVGGCWWWIGDVDCWSWEGPRSAFDGGSDLGSGTGVSNA